MNLTKQRKEQLFIQMLEGIHWSEAELICLAKDGKIQTKYKSVKEDLIREAYPELMPPKAIQIKTEEQKAKPAKKKASLDAS